MPEAVVAYYPLDVVNVELIHIKLVAMKASSLNPRGYVHPINIILIAPSTRCLRPSVSCVCVCVSCPPFPANVSTMSRALGPGSCVGSCLRVCLCVCFSFHFPLRATVCSFRWKAQSINLNNCDSVKVVLYIISSLPDR